MAAATAPEQQQAPPQKEHRKSSVKQESKADTDQMWLETILKEKKAQKDWERKWGFILDLQKELEEKIKELPRPRHRMNKEKEFKPKVALDVLPSPPIPNTSSALVGWRSSKDFWIEKFGPLYVSPRLTIDPPRPTSPVPSEEDDDDNVKFELDKRRSALYTTSVIFLR